MRVKRLLGLTHITQCLILVVIWTAMLYSSPLINRLIDTAVKVLKMTFAS